MALYTGWPVRRSHRIVVSRWLVMPMPAMALGSMWAASTASDSARDVVAQISMGSCSTQPGWGKICRKGYCALATISPRLLNRMARDVVVP